MQFFGEKIYFKFGALGARIPIIFIGSMALQACRYEITAVDNP